MNYINDDAKTIYFLPIKIKKINGEYFVSNIDTDELSIYDLDLQVGDKILSFGGEDIESVVQSRKKYQSGSRDESQLSYTVSSLNSWPYFFEKPKNTIQLTVSRDSEYQTITTELPWIVYTGSGTVNSKLLSDIVKAKILPGNIGLLTLTSMWYDNGSEDGLKKHIDYISKQLDYLANTKALIIDVRYNGGGNGEIGDSIISRFIDKDVLRYKKQLKNSSQLYFSRPELLQDFTDTDKSLTEYTNWVDAVIKPVGADKKYNKPVYILTNERCFSACDTFVDSFSSNKLGEVLGVQTGGGTGYPLMIDLPWDMGKFRFSVMRGYSNHGRYLEGTGTIPDVAMPPIKEDLKSNKDGQLFRAYNYVYKKLNLDNIKEISYENLDKYISESHNSSVVPYTVEEKYWQKAQGSGS